MRIKHLLSYLLTILISLACSQNDLSINPYIELSKNSILLGADDSNKSLIVTSNMAWRAITDVEWLTIELVNNDVSTNKVEVIITAEYNDSENARTAKIIIEAGYLSKSIEVTQAAEEPGNSWGLIGNIEDNLWAEDVPMRREDKWFVAKGVSFTEVSFMIRANGEWADITNIGVPPGTLKGLINDKISVVTSEYSKEHYGRDASDIRLFGKPGTYDVYFSADNSEVYVMEAGFKPKEVPAQAPMGESMDELYIIGDACDVGWSPSTMESFNNNDGIFTWTGNLRADKIFRFPLQRVQDDSGWWPCLVLSEDGRQLEYASRDEEATYYSLKEEGRYTITIDLREWSHRSVSIQKIGEIEWSYTVAGSLNGGWNLTAPNALMALEGKYYVARNVPMQHASSIWSDQPSYFMFKIVQTGTNNGYGLTTNTIYGGNAAIHVAEDNSRNIIVDLPEGNYDIYFDKAKQEVWVMNPGETPENHTAPDTYTVAGSFNGAWDLTAQNARMTLEGEYYVVRNVPMEHGSTYWGDQPSHLIFKILETGSWNGYGVHDTTVYPGNTAIDVEYGAGGNIIVDLPEGEYDVYFHKKKCKVWVMTKGQRPE